MAGLDLPPEELRRLGYRVIDAIVDRTQHLDELPALRTGDRAALERAVGGPAPEAPGDADRALDVLLEEVLPAMQAPNHPRFFARVGSPSNPVSVLADTLASGFNVLVASWPGGSGPTTVELAVVDWLREWCGFPAGAEGVLVTGGSVATLTCLAAAREARLGGVPAPGAVAYLSDQTHASVARAFRLLGFGRDAVRVLESDADFRLTAERVAAAVVEDRAAGRQPWCIVATAGTTNTGAVDDLHALADLAAAEGLWLHVDGAYGAPAALCEPGAVAVDGIARADSLVLDPHKWLFQPYEIGCALVREPGLLDATFTLPGEYLRDTADAPVNLRNRSPQLTRGGRALKLWLSVQVFGLAAFRAGIAHGIALAEHAEATLRARDGWEVVTPAQLGIVCFRRDGDDALQDRIATATVADGFAAPSTTILRGRTVLRFCTLNPRTSLDDIDRTIERMEALA